MFAMANLGGVGEVSQCFEHFFFKVKYILKSQLRPLLGILAKNRGCIYVHNGHIRGGR